MTRLIDTSQFKTGKQVEAWLDDYFRQQGFVIKSTTSHEERVLHLGDRHFRGTDGQSFLVEYKSGIQTFYTGNIFLETISVDITNKPGWIYTCQADFIYYAALLNHKILVFSPDTLRAKIAELQDKFITTKTSKGQNTGYNTHGVLVPLDYAEKNLALKVITITLTRDNNRDALIRRLAQCHVLPGWSVTRQAALFEHWGIARVEDWDKLTDEQLQAMAAELNNNQNAV